jgi:WD40 repeat protein
LWNVEEQACIHSFHTLPTDIIPSLLFSGGDRSVCNAVLSTRSLIRLWRAGGSSEFTSEVIDIPGGLDERDLLRDHDCTITPRTAFSPCGSFLTIVYSSPLRVEYGTTITFYELETMIKKSQTAFIPGFASLCSGVSPDSKTLVLGDLQGRNRLHQTDDLILGIQRDIDTRRPPPINAPLWSIAFDPTCRVLAFGCPGGRLELWTL